MIYTSRYAPISVPPTNVFDLLYSPEHNPSSSLPPPSHPSIVDPASKRSWTRSQVYHDALSLSAGLTKLYSNPAGLEPLLFSPVSPESTKEELKTPLLIFSPNTPSFVLALLGSFASPKGIIPTLANASYTASELAHQLSNSRAAVVFVHPDLLPVLEQCMNDAKVPEDKWKARCWLLQDTSTEGGAAGENGIRNYRELFVKGEVSALEKMRGDARPNPEDVAVLCYSSGTVRHAPSFEPVRR
jgi:4-coumarate--CoA ligase